MKITVDFGEGGFARHASAFLDRTEEQYERGAFTMWFPRLCLALLAGLLYLITCGLMVLFVAAIHTKAGYWLALVPAFYLWRWLCRQLAKLIDD